MVAFWVVVDLLQITPLKAFRSFGPSLWGRLKTFQLILKVFPTISIAFFM